MMPSKANTLLRSIRRWVLIVVFLLGVGVVALADIAYSVSDTGNVPAAVGLIGGLFALISAVAVLGSFSTDD